MSVRVKVAAAVLGAGAVTVPGAHVDGIPDRALVAYVQAAAAAPCPVPWSTIAAMGAVESGHGTHGGAHLDADGKMTVMAVSSASAMGPMQFIGPTWQVYGRGDVNDIDDAAAATARMLCADGYTADPDNAIGAYNGGAGWRSYAESRDYVAQVDVYAQAYSQADPRVLPAVSKERTPQRVWDALVRGWMRVGTGARRVGLGSAWSHADDAMFGVVSDASSDVAPARTDGLDPTFGAALDRMIAAAPGAITVTSGRRTPEEQQVLYGRYLAGGTLAAFSDGVRCASDHCRGTAADLAFAGPATEAWAHLHAVDYGLSFDVAGEPWHVALRS